MTDLKAEKEHWLTLQRAQKEQVEADVKTAYRKRIDRLNRLERLIENHESEWFDALHADLGKPEMESYTSEIVTVLNEIDHMKRHLKRWMKDEPRLSRTAIGKTEYTVTRKPYGSVLLLSPWNYPVQLTLVPLVGAVAAGNRIFVKPSEKSRTVSHLLKNTLSQYFDPEEIVVVEGEADTAQALLEMNWDHIFFTGSSEVGRKVYEAASRTLTPVTLELGGKNPCIVDESLCTRETVKKIIWGKFLNAGQTCIAPDTVYIQASVQEKFTKLAIETIREFYGREPEKSKDLGRLIDAEHFDKLKGYLTQGDIVYGGSGRREALFMEPTVMINIASDSPLATEEIFGPILPIVSYESLADLLEVLKQREAPLVTYLFTEKSSRIEEVEQSLKTGALMVGQVIFHGSDPKIPFGGVGNSGMGRYHGHSSYECFTYEHVLYHQKKDYANKMIFPPYQYGALKTLKNIRKWFG
ncbi:aldehyde dehydrogenase family protein [Alkalibacterium subtropicum]|nr:aldehyde dehydrogenase family protein [Alkalibacterium subtropicum]